MGCGSGSFSMDPDSFKIFPKQTWIHFSGTDSVLYGSLNQGNNKIKNKGKNYYVLEN